MGKSLGSRVKVGIAWNLSENVLYKVVQFLLQLVLARLLVPEDYGLCAIVLAFVNIAQELVNSGFASALVQKKDADSLDFSSVCYFSVGLGILFYVVLFLCAPVISTFFGDERITTILWVMGLSLIIGAYNSVQVSIVYKRMEFRKSFIANLISILISAILGIFAAIKGYGVWALVIQYMANRIFNTIVFFLLIRWLPSFEFSLNRIKTLFNYGWKLMATSLLSFLSQDIYSLVIGKTFSKSQLGIYDLGNKIPANLANTVASTIGHVLFPTFSILQEDTNQIREYIKKINQIACFVMIPFLFGLAATAKPIVLILFTDKWLPAVPIMQISCLWYAFNPIHYANIQVTKAIGRSDLSLYIELAKKMLDFVMLIITVRFGLVFVALGLACSSILGLWIDIEPIKRDIHYSTFSQLKDVFPSILTGIIIFIVVSVFNTYIDMNPIVMTIISVLIILFVFILTTRVLNYNIYINIRERILNKMQTT